MRKVILFAITAIVISSAAHAQMDKGTVLLGGFLFLSSNKVEYTNPVGTTETKGNHFNFTPAIGVAIKSNMFLGLQTGYNHSIYKPESSNYKQEETDYRAELFLRRYFTLGKGFSLFAQPGIYYNTSKQENNKINSETIANSKSVGISLYPGISYAISKRFHLEAGIGNIVDMYYSSSDSETTGMPNGGPITEKQNAYSFSSSLSSSSPISIGFRFFL